MDGRGEAERRDPRDPFEELIERALADLPGEFRERLDTVAIVIDDEATPELLRQTKAVGLFGIYQGVPRTEWGADQAAVASKITIFRRPLEARYPEPDRLAAAVRDTLYHEIAHHFGISDARLDELSREASR